MLCDPPNNPSALDALAVEEARDFADSWWLSLLTSLRLNRILIAGDDKQVVFADGRGLPAVEMASLTLDENGVTLVRLPMFSTH